MMLLCYLNSVTLLPRLCSAMLCYVVLCCAMQCYVVLCSTYTDALSRLSHH